MTRFKSCYTFFLLVLCNCACTDSEPERTNSSAKVGGGSDAGGEAKDAAGQPPADDAGPVDPEPTPSGEAGSGGTPGTGGSGGVVDGRGGAGGDAGGRDAGASGSGGATTNVEDGGLPSLGGHGGQPEVDASAGSPAEPMLPLACENYWDCPSSLSRSCVDYEGVSASAQAAHGCVDGLCVHLPIQQTCGDGADCDGCLALGRAQYCRRETGDACTVCCYGIFEALLEHEIDPDLDCACSPDARCADACADSTICDGEVAPSLDCLGCLREAFQPDGECSLATDATVTDEVCTNDVLDEGPSCGQFGLCMANCSP